jgi:membrane associated rhomboid family serine protease
MASKPVRDLSWVLGWLMLLWAIEIADILWVWHTGDAYQTLDRFGVIPRTVAGLIGIPLAPFLHQGFAHLAYNSVSLFVLAMVSCGSYGRRLSVTAASYAVLYGGFVAWSFGRSNSCHIGASGVAFGLLGFILANGILRKGFLPFLIGVIIFVLYGSVLFGIFPGNPHISWQMHLGGFIGGVTASWVMRKKLA